MEDDEMNFKEAYRSQSDTERTGEPLFIEEEDEDYFEDCLEEIEAALSLPGEPMTYSQKCREALQAEFNGLMQQMLAELDVFDATTSTSMDLFSDPDDKIVRNGSTIMFGDLPIKGDEKAVSEVKDDALVCSSEESTQLSTTLEIKKLRMAFESCIEEVGQLERKRDELVKELLKLEESMAQELQTLKKALEEEQGLLSRVNLEKHRLQEETLITKRRLFIAARNCAQSQIDLAVQQKEVEQLNQPEEELKALVVNLTEEISKLNLDHQRHLQALQQQQNNFTEESSKVRKTRSYVMQGRRASCDLQQYLQGGIKALEEFYQPRLESLLKRREATTEGLRKAKEQCQELRVKLGPLRDEEQKLRLQKTRLEEELRLKESQRMENVERYRETIDHLEENSRGLKTELQIQMKMSKELEILKNSMAKELLYYRNSICRKENTVLGEKI